MNPKEEQEEEEKKISGSKEEGELEDDEPDYDPWSPLRKEVEKDIYMNSTSKKSNGSWAEIEPNICRGCGFQYPVTYR